MDIVRQAESPQGVGLGGLASTGVYAGEWGGRAARNHPITTNGKPAEFDN